MSHAFIDEDVFVPARRACLSDPPNLQWALLDLKNEGPEKLDEIAVYYSIDPQFLRGRHLREIAHARVHA